MTRSSDMTSRSTLGSAAAVAAIATLALPGAAGATAGKTSFAHTFPVASHVCTEASRGAGPKRLRHSLAQVMADCSLLQANFNAARASVLAMKAALTAQGAAARAGLAVKCTGAHKHRRACDTAHDQDRAVLARLGRERIRAAHLYYESIEASRKAFWAAIRALPGGNGMREDARIRAQDS
jgi:hypothetical protein